MADQDDTPLGDALAPDTGDQSLINRMRQIAKTAKNRAPWDPDTAKKDVDWAQKQSDRLSSPNHRLPVTGSGN